MKSIDERDTMFARMNYKKDTPQYDDYYRRNKDKEELDNDIRNRPNICGEGTATYNPINSPIAVANFKFLSDINNLSESMPNSNKVKVNEEDMSKRIKGLVKLYGGKIVGITKIKDYHYYSFRGRQEESYGQNIEKKHKYAVVFAVEMDKEMINRAPQVSTIIETSRAYVEAAIIGMQISYYIRELGYVARNHMDANYLVVLPLLALDAGIGEIGRNGIIVTKEYGSRIRLGAVTTDIPLVPDEKTSFDLEKVCEKCNRCVRTCPGKAIPNGEKKEIDGIKRWQINQENCYKMWRSLGTDCGICISSCPFSQGIDIEDINKINYNDEFIEEIFKKHDEKHGIRPYIKNPPNWL